MKARYLRRSLRLTASLLTAASLANAAPANPQAPPSDYSPTAQNPSAVLPQSDPAPSRDIPIPPRLLPAPEVAPPNGGAVAQPPTGAVPPPGGSITLPPQRDFRDRWHYCMQSHFWGFSSQFQRPPLGYFVYQHGNTEVANGVAVFMTLYQYDFVDGSDKLNLHGRDQLAKIASLLPENFFPIVIERTPEAPVLAEARRMAVLSELAHGPFPVPPQRVVIGPSLGDDLRGVEAQLINNNVMIQTLTRGTSAFGGGGLGGGIGGAGGGLGGGLGGLGGLGGGLGGGGLGGLGGGGIGGIGGMGGGLGGMGGGLGGFGR